jgi:diketogulonate reductase-like aldo/keto reductase
MTLLWLNLFVVIYIIHGIQQQHLFVVDSYNLNQKSNNDQYNTIMNRRDAITTGSSSYMSSLILTSGIASATPMVSTSITYDGDNNQIKDSPVFTQSMINNEIDYILLNDGSNDNSNNIKFPLVSFGLQIYDDETAYKLTLTALEVGYRNFFASVLAGNQRGFAKAIRDSHIPRNELFICGSVVSNRVQGYNNAKRYTTIGWEQNLNAFAIGNINYLDQIMLDYPGPDDESIRGQWSSFIDMMDQKYTKTLAVSNFSLKQLQSIVTNEPGMKRYNPVVNQLPYSVAYHPDNSIIMDNAKLGILVQAWAPLGGSLGGRFNLQMKNVCNEIGCKYTNNKKSASQVALRYILQKGAAICTQTKRKEHFMEDLNIFDFELSLEDMTLLDSLA